ncbi:hypothetical protein MKX01_014905 [Papaver californicum]|nr:hypothetical protein MKX01_014905 [Papaver californicum]
MEKLGLLRLIYRSSSTCSRSTRFSSAAINNNQQHLCINFFRHYTTPSYLKRTFLPLTPGSVSTCSKHISSECRSTFTTSLGSRRSFSDDVSHLPTISDPDVQKAFKDLMALNWDEIPNGVQDDVKKALSKNTEDKTGKEVLENVFRAAIAVEEFSGMLIQLRMGIDDTLGLSGENSRPLPGELKDVLRVVYQRYTAYLDSFSPSETYLRKKVETELGTRMIHLKMRCGGLNSDWGKVTVIGTSGLSGSYIEQRA